MKSKSFICFLLAGEFFWGCTPGSPPASPELKWQQEEGYRWAELPYDASFEPGLDKILPSYTGIDISNDLSEELMDANRILMNGSGVAAGDIDGDGLTDLYFARLDGPNKLYRNLGNFRFEDITNESGVAHEGHYSTGAVFADVDGNGSPDLLVTSVDSENVLYLNDGNGRFSKKEDSGLEPAKGSMTMALADVNGDGYPDLYLVNYREINVLDRFGAEELLWENTVRNGELIPPYDDYFTILDRGEGYLPERHEIGREDELYLNRGDGTFKKVTDTGQHFLTEDGSPLGLYPDWGLAAKFQDLNGDGLPDLYVSNDFWTPDRIWIHQGHSGDDEHGFTFRALDTLAIRNSSFYSMTVDFSDINRDGHKDIFTAEMLNGRHSDRLTKRLPEEPIPARIGEYQNRFRYNRNSLYLNRGDQSYAEISYYSGLHASEWSWSTRFIDLDLDGYEDLLINNGFAYDFQDLDSQQQLYERLVSTRGAVMGYGDDFLPLRQQNKIFRNTGDLRFADVSSEWGFKEKDISLGMALADLDNNGTQDVIISRMNDTPAVYRNGSLGARIAVRLKGEAPNTQAVGAKLELKSGPAEVQTKEIFSGGDYLSGSDPIAVFAALADSRTHQLLVTWPDGSQSQFSDLSANRILEIDQAEVKRAMPATESGQRENAQTALFKDVSGQLGHLHHEDPFDDFRIQPLLPLKLSRFGPGVGWLDLTGNGEEELITGTGKGEFIEFFEVKYGNQFIPMSLEGMESPAFGDLTGLTGWREENRAHLVMGLSNYEQGSARVPSALHLQIEEGRVVSADSLPGVLSSTGPVAATDYTGDGTVDLFIGGRFLSGQYPADAVSRLFKNENGKLVLDETHSDVFAESGLVTGAVFVDYNLDGTQDLILSTEWGTVKVFENRNGRFRERTEDLGLDDYPGLWQGVTVGDFNGDGYPDLAVTNLGENSPYQVRASGEPLRIFYGDFNRDRRMDIIESYFDEETGGYVPRNTLSGYEHIGEILWQVQSNRQFSEMTLRDIFQTDPGQIPYKEANELRHAVFLNEKGNGFTFMPLPPEAQFSKGFYAGTADFDNDGTEDLLITQNFFGVSNPQSNPRFDAGRGLLLKGNGDGSFHAISGRASGIKIYGEQRGAALGDFNKDGRTDLVISQNAAETRVLVNQAEKRGIRVRLSGPPGNGTGIGSRIHILYEDGSRGPARFILAGSGYLSQNSAIQVMGLSGTPAAIQVDWFDGIHQTEPVREDITDYTIRYPESD